MVYVTKTGRTLPDTFRFDPDEARRVVPQRLLERGLVPTIEEGKRAVELVISISEKEESGTPAKSE